MSGSQNLDGSWLPRDQTEGIGALTGLVPEPHQCHILPEQVAKPAQIQGRPEGAQPGAWRSAAHSWLCALEAVCLLVLCSWGRISLSGILSQCIWIFKHFCDVLSVYLFSKVYSVFSDVLRWINRVFPLFCCHCVYDGVNFIFSWEFNNFFICIFFLFNYLCFTSVKYIIHVLLKWDWLLI